MPDNGKVSPVCPWFWPRYAASLLLAASLCYCAVRAVDADAGTAVGVVAEEGTVVAPVLDQVRPAIVIDPGHGGIDPGTVANGQFEKTWTLKVSHALAIELRRRGWAVEITRTDDSMVTLIDRSIQSNQSPRRAFVSIHFNAGGPEASGIETYYAWPKNPEIMARTSPAGEIPAGMAVRDDRGRLLAEAVQASACAATGSKNRGVRNTPGYAVISRTRCPAILVECGFLTNAAECRDIQSDAWREKLVLGLADGLEGWLRTSSEPGYGIVMENAAATLPVNAPVTGRTQ